MKKIIGSLFCYAAGFMAGTIMEPREMGIMFLGMVGVFILGES